MEGPAETLTTLGVILLAGLVADLIGRRTALPRVTLLLLSGLLIGPTGLDLLPDLGQQWFPTVANMALVMVGFLLGEKLTVASLRKNGHVVLSISIGEVVGTALIVLTGLLLAGLPVDIALLLAGIATATDPAATADVVHEARAKGPFTEALLGVVAVDDAWGIFVFSCLLSVARMLRGEAGGVEALMTGAWELGGAVLVGVVLGIPMAYLTGRIQPGEPTLAEALGVVFLCGGIAIWLGVSFLLAAMVLGTVVANLAHHHTRPFHAIEGIEWPFMILFFLLAGASLHVESLAQVGMLGLAYIVLRALGRVVGALAGGALSGAQRATRNWMGLALMPQAGVALGMALLASQHFEDRGEVILPVVVGTVVLFELVGPVLTREALVHVGEVADDRA